MRFGAFGRLKMNKVKRIFVLAVLVMAFAPVGTAEFQPLSETARFQALRIAHAGGGLGTSKYTNSYEALDTNIKNGFKYFELDFVFTSDDRLVCLHDWQKNFRKIFGFEIEHRLSLERFEHLARENEKFTNCTLEGLADWMRNNPSAIIVTDVKEYNIKALERIREVLPDFQRRVIPQIYNPKNYAAVKQMGFEQIIWTLYRYSGSNYTVIEWVGKWDGAFAVTMPKTRARSPLPGALNTRGIATYVHTVNKVREMEQFIDDFGITEIYTDFLSP